jgi:hypothetical protein
MKTVTALVMAMAFAALSFPGEAAEQPPAVPPEEQPEVLTRGPVHEAFAGPVDLQVQKGITAPTQPPPEITEQLAAEKPAGKRFVWVPGYWAWDPERNTYLWVSGCWRAAPPNTYWVPGYWSRTDGGWEWVPGFWAPVAKGKQIEYLPAPPPIDDPRPPGPPPTPNNIWVPPCWYWYGGTYVWRPGYWLVAQPDWIWVPSHYVWTPRGYVFVLGHWDYVLPRRGVLFAPIYFPRPVYLAPGFSYSLSIVVDTGMLQFSWFTCPRYGHFYFGDYYDSIYVSFGIFPRYECEQRYVWYDPIYEHDRWRHRRTVPDWGRYERNEYDRRRADKNLRPPRTYREMEVRQSKMPEPQRGSIRIAAPIRSFAADERSPLKFEESRTGAQDKISRQAASVQKFGEERSRWESPPAGSQPARSTTERERAVSPPTERREPASPPKEERGSARPSSGQRESAAPSSDRSTTYVPPRDVDRNTPESVTIPTPPISNTQRGPGIFREGPPSRPADERRTDSTRSSGSIDTQRESRSQRERR